MAYNAPERPSAAFVVLGLAADAVIGAGELVARNAAGRAVLASDTAALKVIGRAECDADNTGGAAGDVEVTLKRGCFQYDNSGTHAVTDAHVGLVCYVEDEHTVSSDKGANAIVAGVVVEVDDNGVWIETGLAKPAPGTAPAITSTDGTAAGAADLAALKAEAEKIGDDVRSLRLALVNAGILA
jgi:hypothetical protein